MIHRAPFGSMERFIAVLIEHCAGKFPLWLAPEQVAILPISEKYNTYAKNILHLLNNNYDIRGFIDDRNEKTGRKIRDAEMIKIPFMLIVGEEEENAKLVSVRKQGEGDLGVFSLEEFDYKKFLYGQKKRQKENLAKTAKIVLKELRFGPNTDDHDFNFKLKHAINFLQGGARLKAFVHFKGR